MGLELLAGDGGSAQFDLRLAVRQVLEVITSPDETMRRACMKRRVCLYRDDFETVLQEQFGIVFRNEAIRLRFYQLARLSGASSFLKRVSDEVARPVYATPPVRRVYLPGEMVDPADRRVSPMQAQWNEIADQAGVDETMDLVARLLVACSPVFIIGRSVPELGVTFDVATGDCVSVIPDPRKPTRALAIVYDKVVYGRTMYVVVDDTRTFTITPSGQVAAPPVEHGLGRLPVVEAHRRGRWGCYWDKQGQDLESAALRLMVLDAIILKKHLSQSHIQLAYTGETAGVAKEQVLDEDTILMFDGAGQLTPIDLQADPEALLKTKDATETTTGANYGLSRDRLNQKANEGDDDALNERTAEVMAVMSRVEADAFDLAKRLDGRLPPEAKLRPDYRALSHRMKPTEELALWKEQRAMGLRSIVDDVYAMNPELTSREEAWDEINRNMADEAVWLEQRKALNISEDANALQPGQTAKENGAMGPAVRDKKMSKDEAADNATGGEQAKPKPKAAIGDLAARALKDIRGKKAS
jgi:hypothetical protein